MSHPSPTAGTMRTGDILGLSFSALSQQKVRTMLTLVGVAILGLCGGLLGLFLAYLASFPGDSIAESIMEPQTRTMVKGGLFFYPLWLILGAPALAALITTLAAVCPAHRAASVDPITSLRHE